MKRLNTRPTLNWPLGGRWSMGLLPLCALLAVLLTQWPAAWVTPLVERHTDGRLRLHEARGTIWDGSALLALGSAEGSASAWPQRIHWRLRPDALHQLSLGLRTAEASETSEWQGTVRWQPGGWRVEFGDIDWRIPSNWLSALGSPWNTVAPEGQLRIQSHQWHWQQNGDQVTMGGHVTLTLEGLSTRLSSLRPLGDYQITIRGGVAPSVELTTLQGHLQMNGKGLWHRGRLDFQGEAWANQADDELVLSNLLSVLGPRKGTRALLKVG